MTTKQIDYCIELAHTLNFSRAAENQFVSQPTFSYQIKLFEEEIGFAVFERNGKGVSLTPAGAQFVTFLTSIAHFLHGKNQPGCFPLRECYPVLGTVRASFLPYVLKNS